jgi:hypothetical protein
MKTTPGTQRLFHHIKGKYVLLSKAGLAVSFWIDEQNQVQIVERLNDVDFKATGTRLKKEGWKCVGPGMEYAWLLEEEDSS